MFLDVFGRRRRVNSIYHSTNSVALRKLEQESLIFICLKSSVTKVACCCIGVDVGVMHDEWKALVKYTNVPICEI